jgi:hypothetical protein
VKLWRLTLKRGKLKVNINYKTGEYEIQGKTPSDAWVLVHLDGKPLVFALEYDACFFLEMWATWEKENYAPRITRETNPGYVPMTHHLNRHDNRKKNKMAKESRRKNRG